MQDIRLTYQVIEMNESWVIEMGKVSIIVPSYRNE